MTFRPPLYMQDNTLFSYSAADDRFLIDTLFNEGIMNLAAGQALAVQRPDGANMSVYVPPFDAIIDGDDAALQGAYLVRMTVAEYAAVAAAPATNSRIDLLVCEVNDGAYRTTSTTNPAGPRLRVIAGTAAASPVAPALPATAIPIAQITVAAAQTSIVTANITDRRIQSGAATFKIGTTAQSMLSTAQPAAGSPGALTYLTDTGRFDLDTGTAYTPIILGFGDGSDGDVVVSGTVTLVRDMQYRSLRVVSGGTLITKGYIVRGQRTVTVDAGGVVHDNAVTAGQSGTALLGGNGGNGAGGGGNGTGGSGPYSPNSWPSGGGGGAGGGVVAVITPSFTNNGTLQANGTAGGNLGPSPTVVGNGGQNGTGGKFTGTTSAQFAQAPDFYGGLGGIAGGTVAPVNTAKNTAGYGYDPTVVSASSTGIASQAIGSVLPLQLKLIGGGGGAGGNGTSGQGGGGGGGGLILTITSRRSGTGTTQVLGGTGGSGYGGANPAVGSGQNGFAGVVQNIIVQ